LNELQQVKVRGRFVEGKVAFIGPRPPPQELPSSLSSSASNSGVLIIRPFEREGSNGQVLILEGWSPHDKLGEIYTSNHNISLSKTNEIKELSGVIRRGEKINSYMSPSSSSLSSSSQSIHTVDPSNDSISEAARFTFLDVNGIVRALGLKPSVNNGQDSINSKDAAVIIELFRDDESLSNNSSNKKKNLNETIKHTTPLSFPIPRTLSSLRDGVHVPPSTHLIYAGTWFTLSLCGVALTAARFRGGRRSFRRT
jgi:cytochrome oxidase assembly protein ShyY1